MQKALDNSVVSLKQLERSPSEAIGFSPRQEQSLRFIICNFIDSAAILLNLPQNASATAQNIVCASLYLSCKLEEEPKRLSEIITTVDYLVKKSEKMAETVLNIHTGAYLDYREGVLQAEIRILASLGFNVHVQSPHGYLLHYLSSLGLSENQQISQRALNYLHDSYKTIVSVLYQPRTIAVGIIFLTCQEFKLGLPYDPPWYSVFDAEKGDLELIANLVLEVYEFKGLMKIPATSTPAIGSK